MTLSLIVANGVNWAIQVLLLISVTGATLAVARVSDPGLRLRVWYGVLLVSLLLPLVEPWQWQFVPAGRAGARGA